MTRVSKKLMYKLKLTEFVCSALLGSLLSVQKKQCEWRKTKLLSASYFCNIGMSQSTVWEPCIWGTVRIECHWHGVSMMENTKFTNLNFRWTGVISVPSTIQLIINFIFQIWGITTNKELIYIIRMYTDDCCLDGEASSVLPRKDNPKRGERSLALPRNGKLEC